MVMASRLLVIGSNGLIGQHIVKLARRQKWELVTRDRQQLDITDRNAVLSVVRTVRPHVIINAAAYTQVEQAETAADIAFACNCYGASHIAEAAAATGSILLHLSTDYVFSGAKLTPYLESDEPLPLSVYGASKLAGERAVTRRCPSSLILRTSWAFGVGGRSFVRSMLLLANQCSEIRIVNDQRGGPTHAGDIAFTLLSMARQALIPGFCQWGIYHFSGAPCVTWYGFAQAIFAAAADHGVMLPQPTLIPISSADYPSMVKRPLNSCLDCHRISDVFGISSSDWQKKLESIAAYLSSR